MHKYFFHISDFNHATRHLTRIERSIYRDLIDLYMDTESPLTLDLTRLCKLVIATSEQESTAVEQVLNEYFIKTESGWFHSRCDEEISAYKSNKTQKSLAGKASAEAKAHKKQLVKQSNGRSTHVEHVLNSVATESQLTSNQKPVTIIGDATASPTPTASAKKGTRLPDDWQPDADLLAWAKQKRPDLNLPDTVESFCNYWQAKSGKDACKLDWGKTFKNWVLGQKASPFTKPTIPQPSPVAAKKVETPEEAKARKAQAQADWERYMRDLGEVA